MEELFLYIKFALVTAFLTLFCMFLFAWKMSKNISEPILGISSAARSISKGDLKQRVHYQGKDEIGTLIKDFNSMADQLSFNRNMMEKKHLQLQQAYNKIEKTHQQLIHAETLASTGKMAASIVHEIRNPLSTIKMNMQILIKQLQEEPRYREHGQIALIQINHLENMLNSLLDFSRPINLCKEKIDLTKILEQATQMISGELALKRITIYFKKTPYIIECDPGRLKQTIANILLNAISASQPQEKIDIQYIIDEKVKIQIVDYGKGIATENIDNIFDPFFFLRKGGTGLGLSYAKKIMQLHGGSIEVNSELGKGSCFTILLPICDSLASFPQQTSEN